MGRLRTSFEAIARAWDDMDRLNLSLIAAGIGFFAMLALFPALGAVVMLWSLFADPAEINELLDVTEDVIPSDVHHVITDQLTGLIRTSSEQQIGWASVISLFVALWFARLGTSALIRGLNTVYRRQHRAGVVRRLAAATGLTLVLCALSLVAIGAVVIAPIVIAFVPLGPAATLVIEIARWLLAFAVIVMALGVLYRYGPNRRGERPGWFTPGALVAALMWLLVSLALSLYLSNFSTYNEVYGSIGAVVALLMWFYLSAWVVLLGAALNFEIDTRRAARAQTARAGVPPPSD